MAETIEHWKRWISKEPLRLLSRIVGEVSCLHSCKPPSGGSVGQSGPNTTPGHRADAGIGRGWASPGWNAASTAYGLLPSRWRSRRRICGASLSFKERVTRSPSNVPSLKYQSAPGKMHRAGAWRLRVGGSSGGRRAGFGGISHYGITRRCGNNDRLSTLWREVISLAGVAR
jgi:hypothetical protein